MRIYINELKDHVGQTIELKGWAYQTRSSGKVKFLELRDGTGIISCVFFPADCGPEVFANFDQITQECSLKVTGTIRQHPKFPNVFEMGVKGFEIIGMAISAWFYIS